MRRRVRRVSCPRRLKPETHPWFQGLRQPEIQHLHRAVVAELDVGRFEIAMHDAAFVSGLELRRFGARSSAPRPAEARAPPERFQCSSFDELQHERVDAARVLEAVNRGDVRMIERREDFGFSTKPREAIRITRHGLRRILIATDASTSCRSR